MNKTIITTLLCLSAFIASISSVAAQPFDGSVDDGKEKAQNGVGNAAPCASCHGMDGAGIMSQYPNLGGQYADYLYRTLKAYKSGDRENAVMAGQVASLSDRDMRDLAAYYAAQDGLTVPSKK